MLIGLARFKAQAAILGMLIAAAVVFLSPFVAQRTVEEAVQRRDQTALSSLIDVSSVPDNTATWMQEQLAEVTPIFGSVGPINVGGVAQVFGGALAHAQEKRWLTEQADRNLIFMVVRGAVTRQTSNSLRASTEPWLPKLPGRYRDFSHFEFWSTNDQVPIHVVMCREYLVKWRVCGFEGKDIMSELGDELGKWVTSNTRRAK